MIDFDTDCFFIGMILYVLYRLNWFDSPRGTFS
jgi:hypothetical protein